MARISIINSCSKNENTPYFDFRTQAGRAGTRDDATVELVNTAAPTISGTWASGETLTVSTGSWTGDGTVTLTYQWYNADGIVSGATGMTYTATATDESAGAGWVVETATDANGSSTATSNVKYFSSLPDSYQLKSGYFQPRIYDMMLVHPRADAETTDWAYHRRHHPNTDYHVPIGVKSGSWPYTFQILSAPAGATIGEFLVDDGSGILKPDETYGVLSIPAGTVSEGTTETIQVLVTGQDGEMLTVTWTCEFTATGTIFCAADGDDATGDGSESLPFQTIDGWYKSDTDDRTFTGYQVCYKAGTYDVYTSDTNVSNNINLQHNNKPLVHYAYNSDSVFWNFDTGTINSGLTGSAVDSNGDYNFHDWMIHSITCTGGQQSDNSKRWFLGSLARSTFSNSPDAMTGTGCARNTWFRSDQVDWAFTGASSGNCGVFYAENPGAGNCQALTYVSQCEFNNMTTATSGHFNGFYIGINAYFLYEQCTVIGCNFDQGALTSKAHSYMGQVRWIDQSEAPDQQFHIYVGSTYDNTIGGGLEVCFLKGHLTSATDITDACLQFGAAEEGSFDYDEELYDHLPIYAYNNSISLEGSTNGRALRRYNTFPVYIFNDLYFSYALGIATGEIDSSSDYIFIDMDNISTSPFNADMTVSDTTYSGEYGADILVTNLESAA